MSHNFLFGNSEEEMVSNGGTAWEIIKAFKNKEKGKAVNDEKYYEAQVDYDFTENMSNDVLVYLFGHTHLDFDFEKDGVTAVSTANILSLAQKWDEPEEKIEGGWDFAVVDKKTRTLKTKRFGIEGKDREIKLLK